MNNDTPWSDEALDAWLTQATERLGQFLVHAKDNRTDPVVRLASPGSIASAFQDAGVGLELNPGQPSLDAPTMMGAIEAVLQHSVRTLHPRFFNQNFAGPDPVAVLGDWLGAALNTTGATYEAAPVFTLMERAALKRLAQLAGMPPDTEGLWAPGGSTSNLYALNMARHRRFPQCKTQGMSGLPPMTVFTSAQAHYSLRKSVSLLGLGTDALVKVPCNDHGAMIPRALEDAIEATLKAGRTPLMINATAGTTVLGAFDPFEDIARIAHQHKIWMHVDGCYGASVFFSPKHAPMGKGIEQADSLAWNLHKMMGITQQCSALLVKHPGLLQDTFASRANYLFQPDKNYAELDSGDKTFQCARRVDVLKLWLTWKLRGDHGFAARMEHNMAMAKHLHQRLTHDTSGAFVIAKPPSFVNVCFWWIPP